MRSSKFMKSDKKAHLREEGVDENFQRLVFKNFRTRVTAWFLCL